MPRQRRACPRLAPPYASPYGRKTTAENHLFLSTARRARVAKLGA